MSNSETYYTNGINLATIPEVTYNDPVTLEVFYTNTIIELNAEFFINYVLTFIAYFKDY